jgi:magnesium transporter
VRADTSPDHFNTIELDGFLGKNYVITYHHDKFRSIDNVKHLLQTSPAACQRGAAFLLYHLLDQIVDYYSPVLDDFDERIDTLEDDIFTLQQPTNVILEEIMDLKRGVLRLRRISAKQKEVVLRMSRGEFALIGALEAYLSVVSNRINEIMKVLTTFSAIMLPLTFIAGVYGMNFEHMPELATRYGHFVVWGIMIIVAVGMLGLFWLRGWIGTGKKKTSDRQEV